MTVSLDLPMPIFRKMSATMTMTPGRDGRVAHGLAVRVMHWLNALAVLILMASGWRIYNAAPLYDFTFPNAVALGGSLTGALLWHFAFMWLLAANGCATLVYRVLLRRGSPRLLPVTAQGVIGDLVSAIRLRLGHDDGAYSQIQRALYLGAWVCLVTVVASGLAMWKPVQLGALTGLMGDYEGARRLHFWAMAAIGAFIAVHLVMVALVPRRLAAMTIGAVPATIRGASRDAEA